MLTWKMAKGVFRSKKSILVMCMEVGVDSCPTPHSSMEKSGAAAALCGRGGVWYIQGEARGKGGGPMPADEYLQAVLLGRDTLDAVDNAAVRALPAGDHFAAHLHSTMELIICTEGSITLTLFRTPVTLAPGEYLAVYPQIPHCSDAGPQGCCIL